MTKRRRLKSCNDCSRITPLSPSGRCDYCENWRYTEALVERMRAGQFK